MAKRFRFNLDAVLRYREILEDEAKREYLELRRMIEQERLRREEMEHQRSDMQDEIVRSFEERAPIQAVTTAYHMIGRIDTAVAESRVRQQQLEQRAEQKRLAMIEASKKKKVMETLKEHRREEYMQELDRVEQAFLDEMAIQASGRRVRALRAEEEERAAEAEEAARRLLAGPESRGGEE